MMQKISRRHLAQLLVIALGGVGVGHILRKTSPIGRDMSLNENAWAALKDKTSPSREVAQPTLTLVLFSDYRCPACKLSHVAMEAAIQQDNHVRVIYRDLPIFGPMSERAARIAIASDRQGIYPLVHNQLMNERRALDENILRQAIETCGGSWTQIISDLQVYAQVIDRQLNHNRTDAFQLSISGTPTYLVGLIIVTGAQDDGDFKHLFAAARETSSRQT